MKDLLNFEGLVHVAGAALLAAVATTFIYLTQCRSYFSQIRHDFIAYQRQRSAENKTKKKSKGKKEANPDDNTSIIGFFHPHCSSGGGG